MRAVVAHPLLVGFVMLVVLGGSLAWLSRRTNSYQTTANILFTATTSSSNAANGLPLLRESGEPTRLAQTAATLLNSHEAAVLAAQNIGHGWTASRVSQAVSVQPQGQSNIISVTGTASSGELAQRLANAYASGSLQARKAQLRAQAATLLPTSAAPISSAEVVAQERKALLSSLLKGQDPNFSLSESATLPSSPTNTSKSLILILSLLAGFALGSGVAIAVEMLSDRIRDSEELLDIYRLPVLAYIPALAHRDRMRTSAGRVPTAPHIREAFQMIRVQLDTRESHASVPGGHVIQLTSGSSGDGKTTSAINIATALVEAGHSVILIDLDLRKPDLGRIMLLERSAGIAALMNDNTELKDVLVSDSHMPLLSILPAGHESGESTLPALSGRLPDLLVKVRRMADYVVIDTPPLGEVSDGYQLLPLVDEVIVVARPGNTRRANFEFMRELLKRARRTPLGIVIVGETAHHTSYAYYGQAAVPQSRRRDWLSRSSGS